MVRGRRLAGSSSHGEQAKYRAGDATLEASDREGLELGRKWCWRSRERAYALLMLLHRHGSVPQPCSELLLRFLLEPADSLVTWSNNVKVSPSGCLAWHKPVLSLLEQGCLVYTARPMAATALGRYTELRVTDLVGHPQCGMVLGVTRVEPGSWRRVPRDVRMVPQCIWGLPRCSAPRFNVGTRLGYLAAWSGDLVLFIDGVEVGRCPCPELANGEPLWLVADLSHDVSGIALLDRDPPKKRSWLDVMRKPVSLAASALVLMAFAAQVVASVGLTD